MADAMADSPERNDAYKAISHSLLQTDPARSLAVAARISDTPFRNGSMKAAIQALVAADPNVAVTAAVHTGGKDDVRSSAVQFLSEEIGKIVTAPTALPLYARLAEYAGSIADSTGRQHAFDALCVNLASFAPLEAVAVAEKQMAGDSRDRALSAVAAKAARDLPMAESIIDRISDPERREIATVVIVNAVWQTEPVSALRLARGITDPAFRGRALLNVAMKMREDSKYRAVDILREAAAAASQSTVAQMKNPLLRQIAMGAAFFDIDLALDIAAELDDLSQRSDTIRQIALSNFGLKQTWRVELLNRALDYAKQARAPPLIAQITGDLLSPPARAKRPALAVFW
ncbi:MAG: hypothetical protein ACREJQ_08340 [bacterium]